MEKNARRAIIFLAAVSVSTSAILFRFTDAPSMAIVFYRVLFASLLMVPLVLWRYVGGIRSMSGRDLGMCAVSGALLAVHFAVFYESLRYTSVASSLVIIDTSVFFVAILMLVLFGEGLSRRGWAAIAVTFGGSVVISLSDLSTGGFLGDMLALAGSVLFAFYAVIGRMERSKHSTVAYTFVVYVSAAATAMVLTMALGEPLTGYSGDDMLAALGMAVMCTLLGHSVYSWGLKYEKASFIAVTNLLEPVFGSVLALMIFGEAPAMMVILGSAVVLAGVYLFSSGTEPAELDADRHAPERSR